MTHSFHHDRPWAVIRQYPLHRKTIARYAVLTAAERHAQFLSVQEGKNYRVVFDLIGDDDFSAIELPSSGKTRDEQESR